MCGVDYFSRLFGWKGMKESFEETEKDASFSLQTSQISSILVVFNKLGVQELPAICNHLKLEVCWRVFFIFSFIGLLCIFL